MTLLREDLRAEAKEALRYCRLGEPVLARYHVQQVQKIANKLKDSHWRRVSMRALNRLRGAK